MNRVHPRAGMSFIQANSGCFARCSPDLYEIPHACPSAAISDIFFRGRRIRCLTTCRRDIDNTSLCLPEPSPLIVPNPALGRQAAAFSGQPPIE